MKSRKQEYGNRNMVGRNIELLRKRKKFRRRILFQKFRLWGLILTRQAIQSSRVSCGLPPIRKYMLSRKFLRFRSMSFLKSLKIRNKVRFKQYRNKETAKRAALPARLFYIVFFARI